MQIFFTVMVILTLLQL